MNQLEYRLYYDDHGKVVTYTCENLPGNYIIVTKEQFAEARVDVFIKDGKIVNTHKTSNTHKLEINLTEGTRCSKYDVSILVDENENEFALWKMNFYEIT